MAGIMTLSGLVIIKAGKGISSDLTGTGAQGMSADTIIVKFINEAESTINAITRYNYTDTYAALDADVKEILAGIASNLAAIHCISYDMSGYTTRIEAEDIINILRDGALRGLSIIRDQKVVTFINDA